jgi:hypothetical protein
MPGLSWGRSAFAVSVAALVMSFGGAGYALSQASASPAAHKGLSSAGRTSAPGIAHLPAWHGLTLTDGWTYGGFGSYHAAYYKDSGHVVHLRGSAANGSTTQAVFRLPPGARPSRTLWLAVYAFNGSSGGLEIRPDGDAFLFDNNSGNNVTGYTSFDGVTFRVP